MLWNVNLSMLKSGVVLDSGENKKHVIHSNVETGTNTTLKYFFYPLQTSTKSFLWYSCQRLFLNAVRKRSWGKVMFSQAYVKNSVHGGEVYTPWADTPSSLIPPGQTAPRPPGQTPPPVRHPPGQISPQADPPPPIRRPLQRMVRILLGCILV